jgi:hypothetical protein
MEQQQKLTVSSEDDLSLVDGSGAKRTSSAFVPPCSDSSSPLTCSSAGQPAEQSVDFKSGAANSSASQSMSATAATGHLSAAGVKRRRESSASSGGGSSSDEGGSYCKKRYLSHREYKGRKGSPLVDRRARMRRRSSSCSSSPDRRNERTSLWSYYANIVFIFVFLIISDLNSGVL